MKDGNGNTVKSADTKTKFEVLVKFEVDADVHKAGIETIGEIAAKALVLLDQLARDCNKVQAKSIGDDSV